MRAATYFFGGLGYNMRKAQKRGKAHTVDMTIRRSVGRRLERDLKAVMQQWRETAKRKIALAYASTVKAEVADLIEDILRQLDLEGFSVDVIEATKPAIRRAFKEAGISALAEVNMESGPAIVDHVDQLALDYAEQRAAELVGKRVLDDGTIIENPNPEWTISETTRQDLRSLIASAIDDGAGSRDLADSIEQMFAFSDDRAQMIARTELAYAHVQGNIAGYRESGVVEKKKWIVAQDNVCDECADLDGEIVDLDEEFPNDGGDGPPLHPNCRCDVVAITVPEEEEE